MENEREPMMASRAMDSAPLFGSDEAQGFQTRWSAIQTGFVDEPRKAVAEADSLVAEVTKRLSDVFTHERTEIDKLGLQRDPDEWKTGDEPRCLVYS